jgi:hypothetical protein
VVGADEAKGVAACAVDISEEDSISEEDIVFVKENFGLLFCLLLLCFEEEEGRKEEEKREEKRFEFV